MRLNKFISESGICSRREADRWIEAGRVTVNGVVATLGTQVREADTVLVDGRSVAPRPRTVYIALNKPAGIDCTTDRRMPDNIIDFLAFPERIFPIGRLDKDSEGLLLLTNDGDIVNEILRAENRHEKEYLVTVDRPATSLFLESLSKGVRIMGEMTLPCRVTRHDESSFRIILIQGLNRQIRRMCSALGYQVRCLQRIRIMNIQLGALKPGEWRYLSEAEIAGLPATRRQA